MIVTATSASPVTPETTNAVLRANQLLSGAITWSPD